VQSGYFVLAFEERGFSGESANETLIITVFLQQFIINSLFSALKTL
jgi:hypothetical protein